MEQLLSIAEQITLLILVILMIPASYRIWVGPSDADRLQGVDTVSTLIVGVIVVLGVYLDSGILVDVGIAIAAFSFVATLTIARYLSEGRAF
ncbi:MAG: cation:proton antiporter [Chloroflexi bacterium]|nr:cation:proton antiporter [Chloroflexota bacterium]